MSLLSSFLSFFFAFFSCTLQLHTYLAQNVLGKPLVIEEFGLTWFKKTPAQQRVLFQVGLIVLA
jgi:hypothetical protein